MVGTSVSQRFEGVGKFHKYRTRFHEGFRDTILGGENGLCDSGTVTPRDLVKCIFFFNAQNVLYYASQALSMFVTPSMRTEYLPIG